MTDAAWAAWGFTTTDPCVICHKPGDNRLEPRFGYAVCRLHAAVNPIDVHAQGPARSAQPLLRVNHADLTPIGGSTYRVLCPTCQAAGRDGILAVARDPHTLELREYDYCLLCGQPVQYLDIEQLRARETSV